MQTRREPVALMQSLVLTALLATGGAAQEGDRPAAGQEPGPTTPAPPPAAGAAGTHKLRVFVQAAPDDRPPEKQALIQEVVKVLKRDHPENLGRQKTFGRMWFRGITPQNREKYLLRQTAWILEVREAGRIPGGWRATVAVRADVTYLDWYPTVAMNQHYEIYVFRDGKLTLEDDFVDPELQFMNQPYDPSEGLLPIGCIVGTTIPWDLNTRPAKPQPPDPFFVEILLKGKPTAVEQELAKEVERELRSRRPANPNRMKSFPKQEQEYIWHNPDGSVERWKLKFMGWRLIVRRVERIPGGWRATVHVGATLQNSVGYQPMVAHHHTEVYTFRDGKLKLESESIDPNHESWQ
jgi:hypothetical protein